MSEFQPIVDKRVLRERLTSLCSHDTTTGREDQGLAALLAQLEDLGAKVERFEIAPGRTNVLATFGRPRVLLSTHLDTVPPYIAPSVDGDLVRGRGTCDAKGQIVAQLAAIERLVHDGRSDIAWLGVIGEETDSIGARRALELAARLPDVELVIDGEPTDNKLATGHRGILDLELRCTGIAAHSGTPELGRSAIWTLIDWLQRLRSRMNRIDPELGPEVFNIGRIEGGEATNVLARAARARILARPVPDSSFLDDVRRFAPPEGEIAVVHETPPDRFPPIAGHPRTTVTFGSDAPRLRALAQNRAIALVGPGSIRVAHTAEEHIVLDELVAGIAENATLADEVLRRPRGV